MKPTAALASVFIPLAAFAFRPYVTLSVKPERVAVADDAEAEIRIVSPWQFRHNPSISADFVPEGSRLQMERTQENINGTNAWVYTVRSTIPVADAGIRQIGPVRVVVPLKTDFFGFVSKSLDISSAAVTIEVVAPPEKGRPDTYCGAVARDFSAAASLDTNVCTAGDPLIFTLEISGAFNPSAVRPAALIGFFDGTPFKLDEASLKTETLSGSKIFTWRVRAMKAGTVEFPSLAVSWFDADGFVYKTCRTAPIPVQVKAGAQASLGNVDEADRQADEFPMPDGLDLDVRQSDFTLRHAIALSVRAVKEKDFLAAAERYRAFLESPRETDFSAEEKSKHYRNLGALLTMAGRPRDAVSAFSRAELAAGSSPGTLRGLKAAYARIKNDPRAELPLVRIMFPFWFRMALFGRIVFTVCAFIALIALFSLSMRAGRKLSMVAIVSAFSVSAYAWPFRSGGLFDEFFEDMPQMRLGGGKQVCPIKASARFDPTVASVGETVELVITVDPGSVRIEPGSLGMNARFPEKSYHGDAVSEASDNVFKMRASFLEPGTNAVKITLSGVYSGSYAITNANSIMTGRVINQSFRIDLQPEPVIVRPLPEKGRYPDFSGAVGRGFRLTQKLSPAKVRPGDLVTAEYRLSYDGWFPSNAVPRIDNLSREFKAYEIKEVFRNEKSVVWQQVLLPRTVAATNSALVSINCYDISLKRYRRVMAKPVKLVFLSDKASSTENTSVMVADAFKGEPPSPQAAKSEPLTLRFAPNDASPVVTVLPPSAQIRETGVYNGWRRVESECGAGWIRR